MSTNASSSGDSRHHFFTTYVREIILVLFGSPNKSCLTMKEVAVAQAAIVVSRYRALSTRHANAGAVFAVVSFTRT